MEMRLFVCHEQRMLRALHGRWPYRRSHCRHDLHWLVRVQPQTLLVLECARALADGPARVQRAGPRGAEGGSSGRGGTSSLPARERRGSGPVGAACPSAALVRAQRVRGDRVDQPRPGRARQVVAHALDHHQLGAGDRARRRAPARRRHERVGGAVDDERRRGDPRAARAVRSPEAMIAAS